MLRLSSYRSASILFFFFFFIKMVVHVWVLCCVFPVDLMLPDIVTWPNVTLSLSISLHLLTDLCK